MKIVLVEDSDLKAQRILKCVAECDASAHIKHCTNATDAFSELAQNGADLLLLDVRLPMAAAAEASEEGSIWLLREIFRKLPKKSIPVTVGTTQYEESLGRVQKIFGEYLWCVVLVTEADPRWMRQIALSINLVGSKSVSHRLPQAHRQLDVAFLVALRYPEYDHLIDAIGGGELFVLEDTNEHWITSKLAAADGRELAVVSACADEMGMCAMSSLTTRIAISLKPKCIVLTGIMAGNSAHVSIGDAIAIDETWDYRAGKITEVGFEPDVRSQRCSQRLLNGIRAALPESVLRDFWETWKGEKPRSYPKLHVGPVACSPAVVKDERVFEELESQKRKVLGLEMEAYGCYDGARRLGGAGPEVICLKTVCDLGNREKSDKYHAYCAYLAARMALQLARSTSFIAS